MNNNRTVFFATGVLLIILGIFMLIPFFVQWIHDEKNSTFLSSSSITIFIGILLVLSNQEEKKKLNLQQAFLLTTLSWLSIAIFGCLPFLLSDLNLTFVDSFLCVIWIVWFWLLKWLICFCFARFQYGGVFFGI